MYSASHNVNDVEAVALWVGLLAGLASVVLAVVAIWFAFWVNDRATEVNDQTIRSLQKIEAQVERAADDTTNLIKGAWDKMLGQVPPQDTTSSGSMQEVAAGLAADSERSFRTQAKTRF